MRTVTWQVSSLVLVCGFLLIGLFNLLMNPDISSVVYAGTTVGGGGGGQCGGEE
jgi:hypothetical protein